MKSCAFHGRRFAGRRGFTIVELLVAVTIIAMLAAMVSGALVVARQSARETATKATILKLHTIIMAKYESYQTRRVPVELSSATTTGQAAAIRLFALRDLMRMEMPERVADVFDVDANGNPVAVRGPNPVFTSTFGLPGFDAINRPGVLRAYATRIQNTAPGWSTADGRGLAPAECLYMIVMMSCGSEERRQFHESEIGDTNANGLPEFLDGWGRPIFFLRWAPAFNDSDLQPNLVSYDELEATTPGDEIAAWTSAGVLQRRQSVATQDHDRLDPRQVNMARSGDSPYVPNGSRLVPLIYSAGPDGEYGVASYPTAGIYVWNQVLIPDPNRVRYFGTEFQSAWGLPVRNADGAWVHYDNIHNHRIETE